MKKITVNFLVAFLPAIFLLSCNSENDDKKVSGQKITDIPVTTKSPEARASFQEGMMFSDLGEITKARMSFNKAAELDPEFGLAYFMKAGTSISPKEYADNISIGKTKLDSASDWEKMYGDYLSTNISAERNKGIEILQKIASAYPDAARAQVDLGNAYAGNNQFDKSREAYSKAIQLDPSWVGGYTSLTNSYLFSEPKDLKKAEENALKVVSLAPKSSGAQLNLGNTYRAQNDLQKAKDAYTKAIQLNPEIPEAYYMAGNANTFLGNLEEARKNYADAGMRDVSKNLSLLNIAYTYLYAGDSKKAVNYLLNEYAKMDSSGKVNEKYNLLSTTSAIAVHNGDAATLKKIYPMYQSASNQISVDLGNTSEAKIYAQTDSLHMLAMISLEEGKFDEAKAKEELMKTVVDPLKDDRKLETYHADMGMISLKQKNYADAINYFEKADPNSIYYKYLRAKANEALGKKDEAMAGYKEVAAYNFNGIDNALIRNEVKKILNKP